MNERIKHLLAMAHGEAENLKDTNWIANRFAELIVRECVDIVYEIGDYSNGLTKNKRSRNGLFASMIGKTIKEKFGIN